MFCDICPTSGFNVRAPDWYGCPFLLGGIWGCAESHFSPIRGGGEGKDECKGRRRKLNDTKRKLKICSCLWGTQFLFLMPLLEALFFLGNSLASNRTTTTGCTKCPCVMVTWNPGRRATHGQESDRSCG